MDDPVEEVPLGLYLVKGDQMCVLFVCSYQLSADSICQVYLLVKWMKPKTTLLTSRQFEQSRLLRFVIENSGIRAV